MFRHLVGRCYFWLTNYLPDKETGDNAWYSVLDGMSYTVMVGLTQPFMNLYAMSLGASDPMLGFLSSWPALVGLIAQVPSAIITERLRSIHRSLLSWAFVHRINYLIYALIPFLPVSGEEKAWLFIILVTWMNFPAVVVNSMWTQLMGKLFPGRERARVFADRSYLTSIITLLFLIIAGPILDSIPFPYNYTTVFGIGFTALMLSLFFLSKIKEKPSETAAVNTEPIPEGEENPDHEEASPSLSRSPWSGMGAVLKDNPFLALCFALFVMHIGFGFTSAMWTIFYRRQLMLSSTEIARISIISTTSSVIWYRFVPKVMDKLGSKGALLLGITLFAPVPLANSLATSESLWIIWLIAVIDGMAGSTYNLSFFNVILESAADETNRPSYLAFVNLCTSLAGVIFPIVGMQVYTALGSADVRPLFKISSLIRFSAVLLFFLILWQGNRKRRKLAAQ